MNLALDIGNSFIKAGFFDRDKLIRTELFNNTDDVIGLICSILPENIIVSSVKEDPKDIFRSVSKNVNIVIFDNNVSLPVKNLYKTPETLGKDRIAACIGAHVLFPDTNCLIIDAGTCVKCDVITQSGTFLGGSISPGVKMRFEALNQFTARLPLVNERNIDFEIGMTTEESILNGVLKGTQYEMEGFIDKYSKIFSQLNVILTGGDARSFESKIKQHIFVIPNILLLGLNKILLYNLSNTSA